MHVEGISQTSFQFFRTWFLIGDTREHPAVAIQSDCDTMERTLLIKVLLEGSQFKLPLTI